MMLLLAPLSGTQHRDSAAHISVGARPAAEIAENSLIAQLGESPAELTTDP